MWLKTLDLNLFDKQVLSAIGGMLSDNQNITVVKGINYPFAGKIPLRMAPPITMP